jgi:hypothetical protein
MTVALVVAVAGAAVVGFLAGKLSQPRTAKEPGARAGGPSSEGARAERELPARETPAPPRAAAVGASAPEDLGPDAGGRGLSLAPLGDGRVLFAAPDGSLHILEAARDDDGKLEKPARLVLAGSYRLRHDVERHLEEPPKRAPAAYYLDDLLAEANARLERAREAFTREGGSRALDSDAPVRAEAAAREVLAAGDAAFLIEKLADTRYPVRRAAAFAAGDAGFLAAVPALAEVLDEDPDGAVKTRARALLERLAGEPIKDAKAARDWWEKKKPADRLARRSR